MCSDMIYQNSNSKFEVDIAYLAIENEIFVNKTFQSDGYTKTTSPFDTEIWMRFEKENRPLMTVLLTYGDREDWNESLCKMFCEIHSEDDLVENFMDIFVDAIMVNGFSSTLISEKIQEVIEDFDSIEYRFVDFNIHLPSKEDKHPWYDT